MASVVMMTPDKRTITRVPKGEAAQQSGTDAGRRPARDERNNQSRDQTWCSPWRTVSARDETPEKSIMVVLAVKVYRP